VYIDIKVFTADNGYGSAPEKRMFPLFWRMVQEEYLKEFKYMATLANLDFYVGLSPDNINFSFLGFNGSMPNFISESLKRLIGMRDANLEEIFDHTKERLLQAWKNHYLAQSYRQT